MSLFKKSILILFIPLLAFTVHKYYISLTKIDYIKEEKLVQITMRFFIDDMENTIQNRFNILLYLDTKEENKKVNLFFEKYISQKFKIKINNSFKNFTYLGKEYKNDVVFIYLEITDIESINKIEIQITMLFEDFPEQENYIKLNINSTKKTFILIKENDKEMLKL